MKKRFLFCLLLLTVFAACKKNDNYFSDLNKNNTNPTDIDGGTTPTDHNKMPLLVNFKINNASCAFDSVSNSYYYPVPLGQSLSGYKVNFDTTAAQIIYLDNARVTNGGTVNDNSLRTNETISIRVVNSLNNSTTYNLIITGLPIVTLSTVGVIGDDKINGSFHLVDPEYNLAGRKIETTSNIKIGIRGATSRFYSKKSYSVDLIDASGNDTDASLLGLRNDNKWILDAMYIDQGRMRNRLCTDIWNSFNNVPHIDSEPDALNGTRGYMTEVFLNNKYLGLYCLTERLDRKQLKVKKQYGSVYKADNWSNEVNFTGLSPFNNSNATWGGWEFEYPDLGDAPSPDWAPLYNLTYFVSTTPDDEFADGIGNRIDINNMVDYFIMLNVLQANDNSSKNTFLSFYDSRTHPKFFYSVWDLDATFGRNWDGNTLSNATIGAGANFMLYRLLELNTDNFKQLVKDRWNNLKSDQLSKNTINSRIETYRKQLASTGAFARESTLWFNPTQNINTETEYMTNWYNAQFDLVDHYFNNL
ncbi:MAG: CotH kinase family protein [Bacteroidota bacterium]